MRAHFASNLFKFEFLVRVLVFLLVTARSKAVTRTVEAPGSASEGMKVLAESACLFYNHTSKRSQMKTFKLPLCDVAKED